MKFQVLPTLDAMYKLYQQPRTIKRFQEDYLHLVQGDMKGDMQMPIGYWNPMAKEHLPDKIAELQALDAEQYVQELLQDCNTALASDGRDRTFKVSLCIADDLLGGWTNRHTTDYNNRFKLNALVQRNFCTHMFWSSENYNLEKIRRRTLATLHRTLYWLDHPKPHSLRDHVKQESFAAEKAGVRLEMDESLTAFYHEHAESDNYSLIFNFLYGDEACRSLSFPTQGLTHGWLGND